MDQPKSPVAGRKSPTSSTRFWQLNTFIVLAMGCNLINFLFYTADRMTKSATIEVAGVILLFFFMLLNLRGKYEAPKVLSIIFVNAHSACLCYVQGTFQGSYLYLFPFVMAMIFFLRVRENDMAVTVFIIATTLNLLGIVFLLPYHGTLEPVGDVIGFNHLVLNIIVNFLLVIVFFYFVLRLLDAKERRNKSEKKFADTILNTSLDAVFVVDPLGLRIRQYNDKAAELFDLEGFNRGNDPYLVEDVLGERMLRQVMLSGGSKGQAVNWQGDISFTRKKAATFHGFVSMVSFEYSEKNFVKISILDITSVKVAEFETLQAKEKAEKAAATKARFMSNMSHELRTPLNAIIGTTHLLAADHGVLQDSEHYKVLKDSSEHMLQLVNAVLDFSKLDEGKLEMVWAPFNLMQLLKQAVETFATLVQRKNILLKLDVTGVLADRNMVGDEMRLKQIVLNLLSNAIKFTEEGSVTLKVKVMQSNPAGAEVYFAISDTGIGIASSKIPIIFESFTQADAETTRKYGGSGLGLSICRELVRKMGGDLKVSSELGKGSVFYFTLQIPFQQPGVAPKGEKERLDQLTGVRILLVEDNPVNMKIARRFLDGWGASVTTAENGEQAWRLFREGVYDLLLIDLEMPVMDGKALMMQIRNVDQGIPAIAFTAAVYDNMTEDLFKHGFNGFLHKPFRPDDMHRGIASLVL